MVFLLSMVSVTLQILKFRMLRDNADAWVTCGIVGEPRLALGFLNCLSQQANRRQSRDNNTALFVKLSLSSVLFTYVLVKEPHLGSGCVNREFISHLVF